MRKDDIVIHDVPTKEFKTILSGRQFSMQITLKEPPYIGQRIVIYSVEEPKFDRKPQVFTSRITYFFSLDNILVSKNFYDIQWSVR